MNKLISKTLLVLCLATATGLAGADDRFEPRYDVSSRGDLQWRLGDSRGGNRGHEILYRSGGRRWQVAPGAAIAIADGWVLGTDRHKDGYGIYRWNGHNWSRMPGAAVRIGGSYSQPWVINDRNVRYVWTGYEWRQDRHDSNASPGGNDRNDRDDRGDRRGRGFRTDYRR